MSDEGVAPTQTLSIFLIKEGAKLDDLIEPTHSPKEIPIRVGAVASTLFTEKTDPHQPSWVSFFGDTVGSSLDDLQTASAKALLVVPMANRTFAVAFGYGRHLLNPTVIDPTFGLRATLNSVAADKIRSIDMKTFEAAATQTREQASKDTSIGDFGLNVERDVLRAVVGTPFDSTLGVAAERQGLPHGKLSSNDRNSAGVSSGLFGAEPRHCLSKTLFLG